MTKCGSTLAFELARTGLELAGYPQPHLGLDGLKGDAKINFAAHLTETETAAIWDKVQSIGHPIVIKMDLSAFSCEHLTHLRSPSFKCEGAFTA